MKRKSIGRAIGGASLAFGIFDIVMSRTFGRGIGAGATRGGRVFQLAGAREIATGVAGLLAPGSAAPVRWRLAGDAIDFATLAYIAMPGNPKRKMALLALGIVAAVAMLDYAGLRALDRKGA